MPTWLEFVIGYAVYLTAVAWSDRRFLPARMPALTVLAAGLAVGIAWPQIEAGPGPVGLVAWVAVPGLFVLATYRVSGTFFVTPNLALERWLLSVDATSLIDTGLLGAYRGVKALRSTFELLYLLVYAMVPVGAAVLAIAGRAEWLPRYWAVVFAAELTCYATLPWLQTRPPRTIEAATASVDALRQLNLVVLEHGSIQVNTLPSAHAAGAIALALVMVEALPAIGGVFLAIAIGITVATVLGRYHYLVDAVLGVVVAAVAWLMVG
jgi:PAP2 superfamily